MSQEKMSTQETANVVGHTPRLIKEYEAIIQEYKGRGYVLEWLGNCDISIESQFNQFIQGLTD